MPQNARCRTAAVHRADIPGVVHRAEVIADVATKLGLHADDFHIALDSGRNAEAHKQALYRARQLQITVVPTFLIVKGLDRLINSATVVQ